MERVYKMKIIIIGPMGIGKSTVSKIISEKLDFKLYDFDELRYHMYLEMEGYSKDKERDIAINEPKENLFKYWKPFEVKQLEILLENNEGIFDVGGGHVVQEDPSLYNRVYDLLKNEPYVINLYYCEDIDESIKALSYRGDIPEEALEFYGRLNTYFININMYKDFSKYNIETRNKTYEDIADEILKAIG